MIAQDHRFAVAQHELVGQRQQLCEQHRIVFAHSDVFEGGHGFLVGEQEKAWEYFWDRVMSK